MSKRRDSGAAIVYASVRTDSARCGPGKRVVRANHIRQQTFGYGPPAHFEGGSTPYLANGELRDVAAFRGPGIGRSFGSATSTCTPDLRHPHSSSASAVFSCGGRFQSREPRPKRPLVPGFDPRRSSPHARWHAAAPAGLPTRPISASSRYLSPPPLAKESSMNASRAALGAILVLPASCDRSSDRLRKATRTTDAGPGMDASIV